MEVLVMRYYNINRFLLRLTGLWPFQKKIIRQIQNFFVETLFISSVLVQIFKLITSELSMELCIGISTYAIICLVYNLRYIMFIYQLQNIKYLIIRLCCNWNVVIDEKEYEIMEKYALQGKKLNSVCLIISGILMIILVTGTTLLILYDKISPLNGTRRVQPPFLAEYFVDEEVYFYYILTHMYMIFFIGIVVVMTAESFYVTCVIHACGLFHMAGYRFEQAFNESVLNLMSYTKNHFEMSQKISRAIEAHNNAIEFVEHMNSCFSMCYFLLLIFAVATLTVNFTASFQAFKADKIYAAVNDTSRILYVMCYMFCVSYCGQKLIDYSTNISEKVYDLPWFLAPPKIRGLLLVVMQRSLKKCALILGSIFPVSFEFFTLILKLTTCYITSLGALQ